MNNYKTKVNSKDESKEVQELFESLGYEEGACSSGNYPAVIVTTQDWETGNYCSTRALGLDIPAHNNYTEITLAELRDMVVLKRNDVGDATHQDKDDAELKYRLINNQWHVITDSSQVWRKSSVTLEESPLFVKPIEKTMKEYLIPNRNYEYILTDAREGLEPHAKDWIEIPEGADICIKYAGNPVFYKCDQGAISVFTEGNREETSWRSIILLLEDCRNRGLPVLWQRFDQLEDQDEPLLTPECTLNDQYAEIERVRQDMVNHPEHYTQGKVECIDALEAATVGKAGIEAVCVANVIKYLWRYEEKNGKEDIKKAQWYLNKLLDSID